MHFSKWCVFYVAMIAVGMSTGCFTSFSDNDIPNARIKSFKSLSLVIEPPQSATYNLRPSPHDNGMYLEDTQVVIDLQVEPGWRIVKWSGPVTEISKHKTYATILMSSSHRVSVSLGEVVTKSSITTSRSTSTSGSQPTSIPTLTPVPVPTPVSKLIRTHTPYKLIPTPTPVPTLWSPSLGIFSDFRTPTPVPTPTPYQEMDELLNVALYEGIINKWQDDLKIKILGEPKEEDLITLEQAIKELNLLELGISIEIVEVDDNVEFYFIPSARFHTILPSFPKSSRSISTWQWSTRSDVIVGAKHLMSSDILPTGNRSSRIRGELAQLLGLTGKSLLDINSVFYPHTDYTYDNRTIKYTNKDNKFIKMLYDPRLIAGMSETLARETLLDQSIPVTLAAELKRGDLKRVAMGPQLFQYTSQGSNVFFSNLVTDRQVSDMHNQLRKTVEELNINLGLEGSDVPDLYLLIDQAEMNKVEKFLRIEQGGFEPAAFYMQSCKRNSRDRCYGGLYVNLNSASSQAALYRILAHEYSHYLVNEVTNGRSDVTPAWVNEGLAEWSEDQIVRGYENAILQKSERAISSAKDGSLLPLADLESRTKWNRRSGDDASLQYSEAYMVIRFLAENYGSEKALELIVDFNNRGSLDLAIQLTTGLRYKDFELEFVGWLKAK